MNQCEMRAKSRQAASDDPDPPGRHRARESLAWARPHGRLKLALALQLRASGCSARAARERRDQPDGQLTPAAAAERGCRSRSARSVRKSVGAKVVLQLAVFTAWFCSMKDVLSAEVPLRFATGHMTWCKPACRLTKPRMPLCLYHRADWLRSLAPVVQDTHPRVV